ncbi:CopG family transcriptional regulator [Shewanella bicestrii]|uniref:CopG family transcriptional regulator n=1 Tax=unclassified Shewanella TaxID=196818 RepID=UPI001593A15A|nr:MULTISPECIES: CopG family transcriptional regulator [unclassified Shewanella]MDH0447813.1 CopG family transcriptional regulator [Shewanella sp. GD04112]MDH1469562.1 CopG family transcriptional regulator [Shewanella sp. GD03713]QXN23901.1 CopG family transcriptional regulator [Shewanella putrefaciens]
MGLSDLKKNAMPSRGGAQPLSLDEFIDAATLYAMGETRLPSTGSAVAVDLVKEAQVEVTLDSSNVVTLHRPQTATRQLDASIEEERPHYRKATFSLSEAAISHLAKLSEESDISKSKLIRFLIEQHYALPTALRQMREQQIKKS